MGVSRRRPLSSRRPVTVASAPHVVGGTDADVAMCIRFDGAGVSAERAHRGGAGAVAWSISRG
eukprot:14661856-Alexandrium_andersonii.AAC.1